MSSTKLYCGKEHTQRCPAEEGHVAVRPCGVQQPEDVHLHIFAGWANPLVGIQASHCLQTAMLL